MLTLPLRDALHTPWVSRPINPLACRPLRNHTVPEREPVGKPAQLLCEVLRAGACVSAQGPPSGWHSVQNIVWWKRDMAFITSLGISSPNIPNFHERHVFGAWLWRLVPAGLGHSSWAWPSPLCFCHSPCIQAQKRWLCEMALPPKSLWEMFVWVFFGGEGVLEKHLSVASGTHPYQGSTPQPEYVPTRN